MNKLLTIIFLISVLFLVSCKEEEVLTMDTDSDTETEETVNKGIGPIKNIELDDIDKDLAATGKKVFTLKCQACHRIDQRMVGPALRGVTERRSPEWIMNLILNTNEMVEKDPIVRSMVAEYMTKMTFQNVTKDEARAILEFFRLTDKED